MPALAHNKTLVKNFLNLLITETEIVDHLNGHPMRHTVNKSTCNVCSHGWWIFKCQTYNITHTHHTVNQLKKTNNKQTKLLQSRKYASLKYLSTVKYF